MCKKLSASGGLSSPDPPLPLYPARGSAPRPPFRHALRTLVMARPPPFGKSWIRHCLDPDPSGSGPAGRSAGSGRIAKFSIRCTPNSSVCTRTFLSMGTQWNEPEPVYGNCSSRVRTIGIEVLGIAQYFPVLGSIGYWAMPLLAVIHMLKIVVNHLVGV